MAVNRLLHGAKVLVYINNKLFAVATGFQWSSTTDFKAIRSIDNQQVVELAPTVVGCTGSLTMLRLSGDGGLQGQTVVAQHADFSASKYFTLLLVDRQFDIPIFKADMCMVSNESWQVSPKGVMSGNMNFTGITWSNEASR